MAMVIIGGRAYTIELIRQVAELGYPFAEYSLSEPRQVEDQFDDLMDLKDRYGIYYLAHYPNEGSPRDPDALQKNFIPKIKRLIDLSRDLGINKATLHFWMDNRWAPKELLARKIDMLSEMVAHATDRGVVLCLENLSEGLESFSPVFDAIPDLRMTLDIGHGQLLTEENTAFDFIQRRWRRIAHIHVHDNHGGSSVKDDIHLPVGDGDVDYPGILGLLKQKGYDSTITMEIKPLDMPRSKRFLERFLS
jgi:sugar phosphate isomerase/epimerase